MNDSSQFVADLVTECIARLEHEGEAGVDAICDAHPEHADVVRRRLRRLADMGLLHAPDPAPSAPLPERVAGHRLLHRLGAGGMGVVFVAEQERLHRRVALKLVRPEQAWFPGARERFAREAELVAALSHPGIVPVYEVGEDAGLPWLSMEFVPGASLEDVLKAFAGRSPDALSGADLRRVVLERAAAQQRFDAVDDAPAERADDTPPAPTDTRSSAARGSVGDGGARLFDASWSDAALRIAHDVAVALAYAHDQGVLHRDVKPSNVLVGVDGRVRLLDFGLAVRDGAARLTATGQLLGSLAYMPPERLRGEADSRDPRSDVYSLGATLFELLTLRPPFEASSAEALRRAILDRRAPSPRALNPTLGRDVDAVCAVALDPDVERRYAGAASFAEDLRRLLAREPVLARTPSSARRLLGWARRRPATAAAVALATLLAVGVPTAYALVAQRHAGELREALTDTQEQRDRAERNLDLARSAVDTLLADISDDVLDAIPGVDSLRRDLREAAVEFYTAILEQRSDSRELVLRRLDVLRRVASTRGLLGDLAASRAEFQRIADEVAALRASPPPGGGEWTEAERDQLARFEFIATFGRIDTNRFLQGDPAQRRLAREALAIARARAAASSDPMARYDLGNMLGVVGVGATDDGADGDAIPLMHEALDVLAAIDVAEVEPELVLGRRMEAVYSLSQHLYEVGLEHELPEDTLLDVIRYGAAIQADVQAHYGEAELPVALRENRALLLGGMAQTLSALDAHAEAEQLYRFALRDGEAVVAASSQRFLPLVFLASNSHELALLVNRAGRRREALDVMRPLVPRVLAAHREWPEVEQVRGTAALMTSRLGLLLLQTDLLDEAREVLPHLLDIIEEPSAFHLANGHPLIDGALDRWERAEQLADGDAALLARIAAARALERERGGADGE